MAFDILIGVALVLGIIILVHEWGHYIVARLCGVRVDVFSIGFGPRLFGWKRGATDWRISAIPLGGYVRMAGQDLSDVDSNDQAPTGASDELMSKPRWQRALIAFAGPAVNFIFPVFLIGIFCAIVGLPHLKVYQQPVEVTYFSTISPNVSPLKVGDRVVEINGNQNPDWDALFEYLGRTPPDTPVTLRVVNQGVERTISTTVKELTAVDSFFVHKFFGFAPFPPLIEISDDAKSMPAYRAGVRDGDKVVEVNGTPVTIWGQFVDAIRKSNGQPVALKVQRKDKILGFTVTPQQGLTEGAEKVWQIGVQNDVDILYQRGSVAQAAEFAYAKTADFFGQTLDVVRKLVTGRVSVKQLRSVVGIAQASGDAVRRGPLDVVLLMAFISVNLGILNLLPIPILDGGQILMLSIEGLIRRDLSLAVKERFVQVGLVFLLLLFAYVMYNDVARMISIHS
jgi:regulator of sigma E protease